MNTKVADSREMPLIGRGLLMCFVKQAEKCALGSRNAAGLSALPCAIAASNSAS